MYALLFRTLSVTGTGRRLDIGIAANALGDRGTCCTSAAWFPWAIDWKELGKCALVGAVSGGFELRSHARITLDGSAALIFSPWR